MFLRKVSTQIFIAVVFSDQDGKDSRRFEVIKTTTLFEQASYMHDTDAHMLM